MKEALGEFKLSLTEVQIIVRIESSRCTFALKATKSLVISWGGHKKIAAGYTNGKSLNTHLAKFH